MVAIYLQLSASVCVIGCSSVDFCWLGSEGHPVSRLWGQISCQQKGRS